VAQKGSNLSSVSLEVSQSWEMKSLFFSFTPADIFPIFWKPLANSQTHTDTDTHKDRAIIYEFSTFAAAVFCAFSLFAI